VSEYQARVYLALLELGKTDARAVARMAKVPISKIYQTLQQLHERGLATLYAENPRKFAPVPIAEFLDRLKSEHASQIAQLDDVREAMTSAFAPKATDAARGDDRGSVLALRGRAQGIEAMRQVAASAQEELIVVASAGMQAPEGRRLLQAVLATARPGIVRLGAADAGVREWAEPSVLLVADRRESILLSFVPDDGERRGGADMGVRVEHPDLARSLASLALRSPAEAIPPPERGASCDSGRWSALSRDFLEATRSARELREAGQAHARRAEALMATSRRLVEENRRLRAGLQERPAEGARGGRLTRRSASG